MKPSFYAELKRRNVIRAALLYIGAIWALAQGISQIGPAFGMPDWGTRWFVTAGLIGFPFWLGFAWIFELTPEGLKFESKVAADASITRQTGRRLDLLIIGVLGLAVVLLLTDHFVHRGSSGAKLESASAAPAAIPDIDQDPSIAVLPMDDLSQAKDQGYFSDGISEELLDLLAKVPGLRVIARTSSFSFKGKQLPVADIARALNVAALLEGSVRKSGDTVRVSVELVRARDSTQLWSQTYDRKLDDIFAIQDEVAAAVVEQLRIKLLGAVPTIKPVDPAVYPLLLQAQAAFDQPTAAKRTEALGLYQQVLAISPNEARAWTALSRIYFNQIAFDGRALAEGSRLAIQAADRAVALAPDDATALAARGRLASDLEFNLPAAARYYQRALEREPGNLTAINQSSTLLNNTGRTAEAVELSRYRVAHDPLNPSAYFNLGNNAYADRQWDAAIEALDTVLRLSPKAVGAHSTKGLALLIGKHDAAAALKEIQVETDELSRLSTLSLPLQALGRSEEANGNLKSLVDQYGKDQPYVVAGAYAWLGQTDTAFDWLNKAVAILDPGLTQALSDPQLDSLHQDPRWQPLLRKIGYAPEQLAQIEFKVSLPASDGGAGAEVSRLKSP